MKAKIAFAFLVLTGAVWIAALKPAAGGHVCASYSVTAPVVGTKQDTKCLPTPLPSPFTRPFSHYECVAVPPAGVSACATISAHTP